MVNEVQIWIMIRTSTKLDINIMFLSLLNILFSWLQCPRCGFHGQCFGPSICCNGLGCRIGHPSDARQCSKENHSLTPCMINSAVCSSVPNGRCAAHGVCCGTGMYFIFVDVSSAWIVILESCQIDESCSEVSNQEVDNSREEHLPHSRFTLLQWCANKFSFNK